MKGHPKLRNFEYFILIWQQKPLKNEKSEAEDKPVYFNKIWIYDLFGMEIILD